MKLAQLIGICIVTTILAQNSVSAQEYAPEIAPAPATPATPLVSETTKLNSISPVPEKKYSIGPAIEFNSKGTSFGITGKYPVSGSFSVRPLILFGYKPTISSDNVRNSVNGVFSSVQADTISKAATTGFAYGASVTYDFKSADNKIGGYIGPKILGSITSGDGNIISGTTNLPFRIDALETNIGLTAGADFAITPDLTAGLNATYNFFRSLKIGQTDVQSTGANSTFGFNFTYNF
jgi:Opacity family porin protein